MNFQHTDVIRSVFLPASQARLLSNGSYSVLIDAAGSGGSWCDGLALTRWRGDRVEDGEGWFVYLRDLDDGGFWSLGEQPCGGSARQRFADSGPGVFRLTCVKAGIEAVMEVAVVPGATAEIRRIRLRNESAARRRIELTGFLEAVLNSPVADESHPAFSKLFVQTEQAGGVLLARRRPRGHGEHWPWMVHMLLGPGELQWETDRKRFVGRGFSRAAPAALWSEGELSGSVGNVLDPVFALRRVVELEAGAATELLFVLGVAESRETGLALAERYAAPADAVAVFAAAGAAEQALRERLDLSQQQAERLQGLAASMLYGDSLYRPEWGGGPADAGVFSRLGLPWSERWALIDVGADAGLFREAVAAQRYWRALGLGTASLLLVSDPGLAGSLATADDGIHVRLVSDVSPEDWRSLALLARLVVKGGWPEPASDGAGVAAAARPVSQAQGELVSEPLLHGNGYGGFSADGSEYVIRLGWQDGVLQRPPLPWTNVIAHESFGLLVSETGAGCTWSRNSREHRLTPWFNDPVLDPHGDAFYLRDEDSGAFWSLLPGPRPGAGAYECRHGFGYTRFRHASENLDQETTLFVPPSEPLSLALVRIANTGAMPRRLSLYRYQQLVLGFGSAQARGVATRHDPASGVLLAVNPLAGEFADGVAFAATVSGAAATEFTCDRAAFIGLHGSPERPAALAGGRLDGAAGADFDPCFAQRTAIEIAPGETAVLAFAFGETVGEAAALALVDKYRVPGVVQQALDETKAFWRRQTGALRVETPEPSVDPMLNGWLVYQNLSCRLWGRSAFYQAGGAYGFRDQLQDSAALIYQRPDLTRRQILLHAGHQFVEGDVLHWWHPEPIEKGLRTRFSDDLLWLPYVAAFYVRTTGDWTVLDESAPYLRARALEEGEDETYLVPEASGQSEDVYQHCCRALDRSLTRGVHGITLMGTGDWNDGMNRVGREGRGESVWMGFFISHVIDLFAPLCEARNDAGRLSRYREYQAGLWVALNDAGWDGEWYRRAYYDDGTPLGTHADTECRIDALAQAWSVISGIAPPERAASALDGVERFLISDDPGLIRLLAPPFVDTPHDPGYIKGYVAGVRENGGQYTHAACWVVRAMAEAGRYARAAELLAGLSPISHTDSREKTDVYQVEPYVVAADIYGAEPHVGRGGWTWYTGSAGWFYRVALESVLGFTLEEGRGIRLEPRIPEHWPGYRIEYRPFGDSTCYGIRIENRREELPASLVVDGRLLPCDDDLARIPLLQDGGRHEIVFRLGNPEA